MKFEIKHKCSGHILFSIETTSWKLAVEAAVKDSADLSYADLRSANLSSADLRYANLSSAALRSANLSSADLRSADLRYADLSYADLRSANLSSANLRYADLRYADLSYADLRSANLSSADLSYADLSYADLRSANLSSADLRYADLSYADLRSAIGINKYLTTPLHLLRDQPGKIRAYKLVTKNYVGPYNGGITYTVGQNYDVADADCSEIIQCARGINLATLDWCMKEWKTGYHIMIAEFEAKDIAAIPIGSDGKFRVHRCAIVGEKDLVELGLAKEAVE